MDLYFARGLTRTGRSLGDIGPYTTRAEAVQRAWERFPNAKGISSCRGHAMDTRWHNRYERGGPDYREALNAS